MINKYKHRVWCCVIILTTGCATQADLARLQRDISPLPEEVHGVLVNQEKLNNDLRVLHRESEAELSQLLEDVNRLRGEVNAIKSKTDKFDVEADSSSLRFYPSN